MAEDNHLLFLIIQGMGWVVPLLGSSGLTHAAGMEGPREPHPPFWHVVLSGGWTPHLLSFSSRLDQLLDLVVAGQSTKVVKVEATVSLKAYLFSLWR